MRTKNFVMMNIHHLPQFIFICIDLILSVLILIIRIYFFTNKEVVEGDCIPHALRIKILHALQLSAQDEIPESIIIEEKNLANGKHASAYRVRGIYPKKDKKESKNFNKHNHNSIAEDNNSTAIFKIWKPSTVYDALSWASAAFELRVFRMLVKDESKTGGGEGGGVGCDLLQFDDDYKNYLSRNAQYLASFEVETSLYQANGGLGYGTHKLGNVIGAPNSYLVFSNVVNTAVLSLQGFLFGGNLMSLCSYMLLEDMCSHQSSSLSGSSQTRGINSNRKRAKSAYSEKTDYRLDQTTTTSTTSTHHHRLDLLSSPPTPETSLHEDIDHENFYDKHGLSFDLSKICLDHLAGFHSLFLEEKGKQPMTSTPKSHKKGKTEEEKATMKGKNTRSYPNLTTATTSDKLNNTNSFGSAAPRDLKRRQVTQNIYERLNRGNGHQSIPQYKEHHVEIWGEGGYWLGVKRSLPAEAGKARISSEGMSTKEPMVKRNSLKMNDENGFKKCSDSTDSYTARSQSQQPLEDNPVNPIIAKAWDQVQSMHGHRWSDEFKKWIDIAKPTHILSKVLYYQKTSALNASTTSSASCSLSKQQKSLQFLKYWSCKEKDTYPLEKELYSLSPLTMIHGDYKLNNLFIQKNQYASPPSSSNTSSSSSSSSNSHHHYPDSKYLSTPPRGRFQSHRKRASSYDSNGGGSSFFNQDYNVRMIDWQWCGVGVGAADVAHFLLTSVNYENILSQCKTIDYLLFSYYQNLEQSFVTKSQFKYEEESSNIGFDLFDDSNSEIDSDCNGGGGFRSSDEVFETLSLNSCLKFSEFRRQVSLHMIRFVLDTILYKWNEMSAKEMDENAENKLHGLDRRYYKHMEANIAIACNCAYWLIGEDDTYLSSLCKPNLTKIPKFNKDISLDNINGSDGGGRGEEGNENKEKNTFASKEECSIPDLPSDAKKQSRNIDDDKDNETERDNLSVNIFLGFWPSNVPRSD